jgi:hypothetical protein
VKTRENRHARLSVVTGILLCVAAACVGSWKDDVPGPRDQRGAQTEPQFPGQQVVGEEEVLFEKEDEFGRPVAGPAGKTGEFLVVVGYIGTIVAGILLPLFAL